MRKATILFCILSCTSLLSYSQGAIIVDPIQPVTTNFTGDTIAEHYKTAKYDCAIFSASQTIELSDIFYHTKFTPSHTEVDFAEMKLKENTARLDSMDASFTKIAKHITKYKRQYFGLVDSIGHKVLRIYFFSNNNKWNENDYWLKHDIFVWDGGHYYWYTTLDLNTGRFTSLKIGGNW